MQVTSASTATTSQPAKSPLAAEPEAPMTAADPRYAQYKVIRRNGAVVGFEPAKITHRDDQGVPRRQRRPGRGVSARVRERGREAHRRRRRTR